MAGECAMKKFLARWGSTLIVWSFLVTAVTGVLLFLRVRAAPTEELHIWIGMLMLLAFILHVARNWKAFVGYFRKPPTYVAAVLTVVASVALAYPALSGSATEDGPPGLRSMASISAAVAGAPLSAIAPLAQTDAAGLIAELKQLGVPAGDPSATLKEVAAAAGKDANVLLASVLAGAGASE
jgi:hypothetical protein